MTTNADRNARLPGSHLLTLARMLFSDRTVSRVFAPAVADFREELRDAQGHALRQITIRCRWYWSLLVLAIVVPHVVPDIADRPPLSVTRARAGGWFVVVLAVALYGATWQVFGWFALASVLSGSALAFGLRAWHTRHPPLVIDRRAERLDGRDPEINLSSIHVGGDVAGLMFAVGSVAIVLVGLPGMWWFFAAGAVSSLALAWARYAWMRDTTQPASTSITSR